MLTGQNGILTQAQNAKNQTEKAEDKERIKLAVNAAQISDNGFKELGQNSLQEELDKEFGEGKTVVRDNEDVSFIVNLRDDKKDYTVLSNGQIQDGVDWNDAMAKAKALGQEIYKSFIQFITSGDPNGAASSAASGVTENGSAASSAASGVMAAGSYDTSSEKSAIRRWPCLTAESPVQMVWDEHSCVCPVTRDDVLEGIGEAVFVL